jgi:hypothetical protein
MNVQEEIDRVSRYGQQPKILLDGKGLQLSGDRDAGADGASLPMIYRGGNERRIRTLILATSFS